MDRNVLDFANICCKMLLKAIGQALGTAKRVQESRREIPKGFQIVSGEVIKGIGKLRRKAEIILVPTRQMKCS
jgi:hypothetical protein